MSLDSAISAPTAESSSPTASKAITAPAIGNIHLEARESQHPPSHKPIPAARLSVRHGGRAVSQIIEIAADGVAKKTSFRTRAVLHGLARPGKPSPCDVRLDAKHKLTPLPVETSLQAAMQTLIADAVEQEGPSRFARTVEQPAGCDLMPVPLAQAVVV